MKTYQWKLRRQFIAIPDAQQRWDRVYQHLLCWTRCHPLQQSSKPVAKARLTQEA